MNGHQYPFIASRIFGTPLLVEPNKLRVILASIGDRFGLSGLPAPDKAMQVDGEIAPPDPEPEQPNRGVAVIPIMGTTVARGSWMDSFSGLASYVDIQRAMRAAKDDDSIESILLDFSSFGGEAELVGETAAVIREVALVKPVKAVAHDYMASAAMWLGSAASELIVTAPSEIGSIGVVLTHMSLEGAAKEQGIAITHIHAGAHKVDFSPYFDLTEGAIDLAQASVDSLYEQFTAAVAEYRGIDQAAVKATEAKMFTAEEAVARGLADRVDTFDNVLSEMQAPKLTPASTRGITMSNEITTGAQLRAAYPELCNEIASESRKQAEAANAEAIDKAVTAERERIAAVQDHPEAEGREAMARQLAFTPGMTAEVVEPILKAAPKAAKAEPKTGGQSEFSKHMANHDPDVSGEPAGGDDPAQASQADINAGWGNAAQAAGYKKAERTVN